MFIHELLPLQDSRISSAFVVVSVNDDDNNLCLRHSGQWTDCIQKEVYIHYSENKVES